MLKLVVDSEKGTFFLLSEESSAYIEGKLGESSFLYNIRRGIEADGLFTGTLRVQKIPFFNAIPVKKLEYIANQSPTKENSRMNFVFFSPEKYESGEITKAPRTLSRKNRGKWWNEMKAWKATQEIETAEVKLLPATPTEPTEPVEVVVPEIVETETAKETPPTKTTKEVETIEVTGYFGAGNHLTTLEDAAEGYVIAHHNQTGNYYAVLGTPDIVIGGKDRGKAFFVCRKVNTAQQFLSKLKEHPFYAPFVSDKERECKVVSVTDLPVSVWEAPALEVTNLYSLFNGKMLNAKG